MRSCALLAVRRTFRDLVPVPSLSGALAVRSCARGVLPRRSLSSSATSPSATPSHGLSHVDESGGLPRMVDVGDKAVTRRSAVAHSLVLLPRAVESIFDESRQEFHAPKGPVFVTAVVAGTSAVKLTSTLLPFCHPLPLERVRFSLKRIEHAHTTGRWAIDVTCEVACTARTGVEMEALTGASVAALTVYDMLKALSHDIVIADTRLVAKTGGKAHFHAQQA